MEYLNHVLGIHVFPIGGDLKPMPNFIHTRYRMHKVTLDGMEVVFVYPKRELDSANIVKKHLERIGRTEDAPAVLVPDRLTYRQKEYLLRERIPFVVEGKQIYLPFMAVYLQERGDGEKPLASTMLPSAQLLLLYYIYHGCGEMLSSAASVPLSFTPTSISRASRQLEEMGLIQTKRQGVSKVIFSDKTPKKLFTAAKKLFSNPIKRTIYIPKTEIKEKLLLSGYSALSEYSMLNPPPVEYRATDSVSMWETVSSNKLQNSDSQYAVELWRYNPKQLADGECVDRLSLALALRENRDERIQTAVDEMLAQVWKDIDDKRVR